MQLWKPSLLILPAMLELALRLLRGLFLPFLMELLFFLANPRELFLRSFRLESNLWLIFA